MVDVFRLGKFELLGLIEIKLKGNREVLWYGVDVIITGVQEIEKARESAAVLLNNVWHIAVIDLGCVSFRILWVKYKFSRVKVCVVMVYVSTKEDGKERERFWKRLVVDRVGNVCTMSVRI